jgi:hypothetical protein
MKNVRNKIIKNPLFASVPKSSTKIGSLSVNKFQLIGIKSFAFVCSYPAMKEGGLTCSKTLTAKSAAKMKKQPRVTPPCMWTCVQTSNGKSSIVEERLYSFFFAFLKKRSLVFSFFLFYTIRNEDVGFASIL